MSQPTFNDTDYCILIYQLLGDCLNKKLHSFELNKIVAHKNKFRVFMILKITISSDFI